MKKMKSYTELDVWIHSRGLVKQVYQLTQSFPKVELYSLTSQIRRSVVSVPFNIAEGVGRQSDKETLHFLYISKGSLFELETQLYLSFDLEYILEEQLKGILEQLSTCKKLLNGFINYFKNKS